MWGGVGVFEASGRDRWQEWKGLISHVCACVCVVCVGGGGVLCLPRCTAFLLHSPVYVIYSYSFYNAPHPTPPPGSHYPLHSDSDGGAILSLSCLCSAAGCQSPPQLCFFHYDIPLSMISSRKLTDMMAQSDVKHEGKS